MIDRRWLKTLIGILLLVCSIQSTAKPPQKHQKDLAGRPTVEGRPIGRVDYAGGCAEVRLTIHRSRHRGVHLSNTLCFGVLGARAPDHGRTEEVVVVRHGFQEQFPNPRPEWLLKANKLQGRVLSIAEGTSGLVPFLNRSFGGKKAYGLDLCYGQKCDKSIDAGFREMLSQYQKRYKLQKDGGILIPGDASELPLQDSTYDVVLMHKLLNNISSAEVRQRMISEAFRVLRPGGSMRLTTNEGDCSEENRSATLAGLPDDSYDYLMFISSPGISQKETLPLKESYPSDSFPFDEMMSSLKKTNINPECLKARGLPIIGEMTEDPLCLLIVHKKTPDFNLKGLFQACPGGKCPR